MAVAEWRKRQAKIPFTSGHRVAIRGMEMEGVITKVRRDDRGEAIYTVELDTEGPQTPDGIYYAREQEIAHL